MGDFRNAIKIVKTYPAAHVGSDHNPVKGNLKKKKYNET